MGGHTKSKSFGAFGLGAKGNSRSRMPNNLTDLDDEGLNLDEDGMEIDEGPLTITKNTHDVEIKAQYREMMEELAIPSAKIDELMSVMSLEKMHQMLAMTETKKKTR